MGRNIEIPLNSARAKCRKRGKGGSRARGVGRVFEFNKDRNEFVRQGRTNRKIMHEVRNSF